MCRGKRVGPLQKLLDLEKEKKPIGQWANPLTIKRTAGGDVRRQVSGQRGKVE